jgi:glycerophosphoryl diester phosphodiesterase
MLNLGMKAKVLITIALFSVSCTNTDRNAMKPETITHIEIPSPDMQGHRGARGLLPENTVPSFLRALELGVTTLELDLVVSRDSMLVVSHEPWFNPDISSHPDGRPVTEQEGKLLNLFLMDYEEIKSFDVGSRGNPRFPEQMPMQAHKPTLSDVVLSAESWIRDNAKNPVWYNIETKSDPREYDSYYPQPDAFAQLVVNEIYRLGIENRTVIQSFDPNTLIEIRAIDPRLHLALLIENQDSIEDNLDRLGFTPEIYSPYYQFVDSLMVTGVHEKGMRLIPWTINDSEEIQRLLDLGVDGIISDYPNLFEGFASRR